MSETYKSTNNPRNIPIRKYNLITNFPIKITHISHFSFEDFNIALVTTLSLYMTILIAFPSGLIISK